MLKIDKTDKVALVTLDRPEAMNALSRELRSRLHVAFVELDADDGVSVVVLTGAGRAFTAGLDLKELGRDPLGMGAANATGAEENPVLAIRQCRKPVIGAINGVAITGGFELALACDVLIALDRRAFRRHPTPGSASCRAGAYRSACPARLAFTAPRNFRSAATSST